MLSQSEAPDSITKENFESAMTLTQCQIELQSVAVSDTTDVDGSNLFAT
jgi:hypothetical protein